MMPGAIAAILQLQINKHKNEKPVRLSVERQNKPGYLVMLLNSKYPGSGLQDLLFKPLLVMVFWLLVA